MSDSIDDLLDRSAPVLADRGAGRDAALSQMTQDARDTVRPQKRSRRRVAVLSGLTALLIVGGAGVATANSDWLWGPGLENPDRSYTYTSPTWGQCEIRYSGIQTGNPLIQANVDRVIDDWFANTDVEAAAEPFIAEHLAVIEASQANDPEDVRADPRLPDLNAWLAHDQALSDAMWAALAAQGYETDDFAWSSSHSQINCDAADWGGTDGAQ